VTNPDKFTAKDFMVRLEDGRMYRVTVALSPDDHGIRIPNPIKEGQRNIEQLYFGFDRDKRCMRFEFRVNGDQLSESDEAA